jgi:tetratricopeptide (TPR) repeat protein
MLGIRPAADLVESLFEGRLARSPEGPAVAWSFVHGMLREALEMRAKETGRFASHHRVCARLLERLDPDGNRERRAWHLMAAGAHKETLPLFLQCAEEHIATGDVHAAHLCLDARDQALQAIDPDGLHPARASGWVLWACLWRIREDFAKAREYGLKAVKLASSVKSYDTLYRAYRELGVVYILCGVPGKALRYQKLAAQAAQLDGSAAGMVDSLAEQGWIWLHRGDLQKGRECFMEAAEKFERQGVEDRVHGCWLGLAEVARMGAQYEEAGVWLEKVNGDPAARKNRWTRAAIKHFQSNLARSRGDLDLAEERMLEAGQLYAETGSAAVKVARLNRGLLLIAQDRVEEGQRLLREVLVSVAKERVPIIVMVRCGLLVGAAHDCAWIEWDEHCAKIIRGIESSDYVDADVAALLFMAGKMAADAGEIQRSRSVMVVSKGLYLGLGREEAAREVSTHLREPI